MPSRLRAAPWASGRSKIGASITPLRSLTRPSLLLLAAVLAACTGPIAPASPPAGTPVASTATAAPTSAPTFAPTGAPTPTPTAAPTASPSPTPTASPIASQSPSADPASPKPSATVVYPSLPPTAPPAPDANTGGQSAVAGPRLKRALDEQRALRDIPGIAAAVIFPDGTMWSAGSGYSRLLTRTRSTNATPYVVGSITKTFISAAIMQLDDEGALSIDDPLSNWLPDYPRASAMTLRQLLNHTAGVFNYFEHPSYNSKVFGTMKTHFWTPDEILTQFARAPYFSPGGGFRYSNTGFVLLGLVIEAVTGKSLDDVLDERFFAPLGMSGSYFQYEQPGPASAAHGYLRKPDGTFRQISDSSSYRPQISAATVAWAAGGIVADPRDIARWADALYGGEGVVSDDALAQMTDYLAASQTRATYGLGTRTRTYNGYRMFGHTGSLRGFDAAMWHYPDIDLTVVVLTNRGRIDPNPTADALAAIAMSTLP